MFKKTFNIKIANSNPDIFALYKKHSTFHEGDAGVDLFIIEDISIKPQESKIIDLGIQCQSRSISWCPWNWTRGKFYKYHSYFLFPRSSISKTPLIMVNSIGLIDKGYIGNIKAPFLNTSSTTTFHLKKGDRYCQIVNGDLSDVHFKIVTKHRETSRGSDGFGSTGI